MFYNGAKKTAIKKLKEAEAAYNQLGIEANTLATNLYNSRKFAANAIDRIELYINMLANSPKEFQREIGEIQVSIKDFHEAMNIEKENASANIKAGAVAGAGAAIGGAIATMGPTAAMAIATTFGTASTGTAIASLSGAAATNAALAWLGGGALAAGGGGMAAGNAFLALAGPVGWGIAGVLAVGGGIFASHKNKKTANLANESYLEIVRRKAQLIPMKEKLCSLIARTDELRKGLNITMMVNTYPKDYLQFNQTQKENLLSLINNARAMGQLINERIGESLETPWEKYTEDVKSISYEEYLNRRPSKSTK